MGIFDSIKKALGGDDKKGETTKGPSMVLREAGIDPSNLKFGFAADGTVTVTGYAPDAATRDRISELVGDIPNVSAVVNEVQVGAPAEVVPEAATPSEPADTATPATPAEPAPEAEATEAAADEGGESVEAVKTYEVQPGDSLWKIAASELGSGARYTEIFEANRDILDDPDVIKPGQVLKIPS